MSMKKEKRTDFIIGFFLCGIGFLSRFFLRIEGFSAPDSVQYAFSLSHFSMANHTPPPPGYFLYVMSGKLLNIFFNDSQFSLVLISVIYSAVIPVMLYFLGKDLFGRSAGLISALLFLSSPVLWYKGITIYGYLNSGFFILLTAYFCFKVMKGEKLYSYGMAVAFAITVGIRSQEFLVLLPLCLFTIGFVSWRIRFYTLLLFGLICLMWFIPLTHLEGGLFNYLKILKKGSDYLREDSFWGGAWLSQISNHLTRMSQYFERTYLLAVFPFLYFLGQFFSLRTLSSNREAFFLLLLIGPSLLFNIFILYAEVGHGMPWIFGVLLIMGKSIETLSSDFMALCRRWITSVERYRSFFLMMMVSVIVLFNGIIFFHDFHFDVYGYDKVISDQRQFNYPDVKEMDRHLLTKVLWIKSHYSEKEILILSKEFNRMLSYYFPTTTVLRPESVHREHRTSLIRCEGSLCISVKTDSFELPKQIKFVIIFDHPWMVFSHQAQGKIEEIGKGLYLKIIPRESFSNIKFSYHDIVLQ